jgi:hypothetical protein
LFANALKRKHVSEGDVFIGEERMGKPLKMLADISLEKILSSNTEFSNITRTA